MQQFSRKTTCLLLASVSLLYVTQSTLAQTTKPLPSFQGPIAPGFQQPQPGQPGVSLQQANYNAAVLGAALAQASPLALGFNPYPQVNGFGPVRPDFNAFPTVTSTPVRPGLTSVPYDPGYGGGYFPPYYGAGYGAFYGAGYGNSYSASLMGLADLTYAQGQYLNDWQRARMTNQQVEQAKIETRKQMLQLWQYERMNTPTLEEIRTKQQDLEVRRARRDPPLTEILSGKSLNDLYNNSKQLRSKGIDGPAIKLDAETLKKITLTSGRGGNIGPLKNEGKLTWSLALKDSLFEKDREALDQLAADAVKKAEFNNTVDPATLNQMRKHLDSMTKTLESNVNNITTSKFMDASRYLNKLEDAVTALEDPNVSNFFTQKWAAKGKSVGELIDYMAANGLRFAASAPGEEAAYQALQSALASYDYALSQKSASNKP